MKEPSPAAEAFDKLTEMQQTATKWREGAMLVLAGPGSGKTRILTSRIASILEETSDRTFRVLALTFTNKAADEMANRVALLVPGLESRTFIGTFHSFCMHILRQHGSHIGITPDFSIYSQDDDRKELLLEELRRVGNKDEQATSYLSLIDKFKSQLIDPQASARKFGDREAGERFSEVYAAYEAGLARVNALDFASLVSRAYSLISKFPGVAMNYRKTYAYWMIDEFQDTTDGQYRLIEALAGDSFRNIFAVADDDQIIYQWNGASFQQIQRFRADYGAVTLQLPTNYRCPPAIVNAANNLVGHNSVRTTGKLPLEAGKAITRYPVEDHIHLLEFPSDQEEAAGIAAHIAALNAERSEIVVLGRSRAMLETIQKGLTDLNIPSVIAQRRDDFLSPQFQWWCAVLRQVCRPLDKRNFGLVCSAFNRMFNTSIQVEFIISQSEASSRAFLNEWALAITSQFDDPKIQALTKLAVDLTSKPGKFRSSSEAFLALFPPAEDDAGYTSDLAQDRAAWLELVRSITQTIGRDASLEQFLQELSMRSKEPSPKADTVSLMTIHAAKGKEFDHVYLVGLAEGVLPSFQSLKKGDDSAEMEEERRNCFVAITRTKECLTLSRAKRYRGWAKEPSRFLSEMGFSEME